MEASPEFYTAFKQAYDSKQFAQAGELVLDLFKKTYPEEMASGIVDKELLDMYISVLDEQKIELKKPADVNLFLLEEIRKKLFGEDDDEDDWNF